MSAEPSPLLRDIRARLQNHQPLLMTHAVVGYPSLEDNWRMLEIMQETGVDIVELQLPFSEPIADGPRFVRANQHALERGVGREQYFELVERAARTFDFSLLFMGYYNSVYRMGHEAFCDRLAAAGARGFIIADLPPESARELNAAARERGLDPILLMTPTSGDERLAAIAAQASGFVYCVARKGVTGKKTAIGPEVKDLLERCRRATPLPLALGFGVRTGADVRALSGFADIAIVGTACLAAWEDGGENTYTELLRDLRGDANG